MRCPSWHAAAPCSPISCMLGIFHAVLSVHHTVVAGDLKKVIRAGLGLCCKEDAGTHRERMEPKQSCLHYLL